jgi:putative transposase
MEYKSNNNIVFSCKYHVVWCPKYRRKVLVGNVEARLKELIQETCLEIKVDIIEMDNARPCTFACRSRPSIWNT